MGIFDYFTPEARRGNRQALEGLLMQFIPPEMRPQLNLLAELNPVVSMERAGQDAQQLFAPDQTLMDRLAAGGRMASNMAGVVAPAMVAGRAGVPVANAVQEALTGYAPMVQPFMADEFGGFRLYQGSPHNFAAERLVRMPDGSTQYVVGAPDRLPDVPTGAEVLQDFPLGRQRMDKIGTGEGAQAFGYGLYGAENEGVARGYRDVLSADAVTNDPSVNAFDIVKNMGGNVQAATDLVRSVAENASPDTQQFLRETLKHLENKTYSDLGRSRGYMYELDVNANPQAFLDWDRPISEQPQILSLLGMPPIRSYATIFEEADSLMKAGDASVGRKNGWMENPEISARVNDLKKELNQTPSDMSVQNLLMQIGGDVPNPQGFNADRAMVAASGKLREAGVPGIRYLDAGSRSTGGTRNYVIFDENLINIVRKYGIAGAAAMLGMSQADVAQAMGQQPQGLLESGPQ